LTIQQKRVIIKAQNTTKASNAQHGGLKMNFIKEEITKARNGKQLNKILMRVKNEYGFLSKEYNEVLNLCWNMASNNK
jgi:hypothetical protein